MKAREQDMNPEALREELREERRRLRALKEQWRELTYLEMKFSTEHSKKVAIAEKKLAECESRIVCLEFRRDELDRGLNGDGPAELARKP